MAQVKLGLDEASITINKTANSQLGADPILVFYQIDECFGCPLEQLKKLEGSDQTFVLGTKYSVDLELRRIKQQHHQHPVGGSSLVCNLAKLSLRNHARYRIDIQEETINQQNISSATGSSCSLQTIEEGDCSYCPIALLFLVLLLVTAFEKLYTIFIDRSRHSGGGGITTTSRRPISKSSVTTIGGDQTKNGNVNHQEGEEDIDEGLPVSADNTPRPEEALTAQMIQAPDSPSQQAAASGNQDIILRQDIEGDSTFGSRVARPRIESLDAFRGLTIAGMIIVNYGGAGYKVLEHQPWDGLTLADLVFPFFIFSMGASIALSTKSLMKRGKSLQEIFVKIIRRACILMLLGLCLNSKWLNVQTQGLDQLRLTGVLQRFSISYLVVASMYAIKLSVIKWIKAQSLYRVPLVSRLVGIVFEYLTALNYLAVYLYVTFFLPYSDTCPTGYLGPGGMTENGIYANCTGGAAAWLDRTVLGQRHLYHDHDVMQVFKTKQSHDPEGLLGNTTSVLLTLVGLQCGKILSRSKRANNINSSVHRSRLQSFIKWQLFLALISISAIFIPINKRLWSLPFVSVTAIFAFALMTLLYTLLDIYECQRTFLIRLLISAGKNSIFLYVGHSLLSGMLPWHFYVDESFHLQLLLRLSWSTLCWLLIAHYMASKRLFIRV